MSFRSMINTNLPVRLQEGIVKPNAMDLLQKCANRFALNVLHLFIKQNALDSEKLLELNRMIREARECKKFIKDDRIVWHGLTIFALYTYFGVTDLGDIAEYLHLSTSAVKRWIHAIYEAFDLPLSNFTDKTSRRKQLRLKVVEEGFQKYPLWLLRTLLDQ